MLSFSAYFIPNRLFIYLITIITISVTVSVITLPAHALHSFDRSNPIEPSTAHIKAYIPKQALLVELQDKYNVVYFIDNSNKLTIDIKRVLNDFGYVLKNHQQTYAVITQHINTDLGYERLFNIATYIALQFDIEEERIQLLLISEGESRLYQDFDDNWKNSAEIIIPKAIIVTYDPYLGTY
ncbi:hypothetical protein SKA34_11470 [Photobacterium sp. SKA34]|uniref:hypothetical protein n=1 Tax=Photobacterium sp. SKA34 TaxID=121723 RepID=UPI00006BA3B6|nr:hypothetical protein [Photobacterium sp. SKA34]EAR56028.1 hypothetical protein SKA34_11470 [Photobacterium sp. SKA34]